MKIRQYKAQDRKAVWDLMNRTLEATGMHAGKGVWDDDLRDIEAVYTKNKDAPSGKCCYLIKSAAFSLKIGDDIQTHAM